MCSEKIQIYLEHEVQDIPASLRPDSRLLIHVLSRFVLTLSVIETGTG